VIAQHLRHAGRDAFGVGEVQEFIGSVIMNCVRGKRRPSIAMKGMVPPTPVYSIGRPNALCEARCMDASSQGSHTGACQPSDAESISKRTRAP
jgi:hypothetical protein